MRLQVTKSGVRVSRPSATLEGLRADFEREQFVRLPRFLAADLLQTVSREIERGEFYERSHGGIDDNKELCLRADSTAAGLLHVLLNSAELFELVEQVTGCGTIGCFQGRVYRVVPGRGHGDAWHSDVGRHRLVALSVNLSRRRYRGAMLQMRRNGSKRILREIPNPGFGDAILFHISRELEHRITDIEGAAAKTAFAGWFQAKPTFGAIVDRARARRKIAKKSRKTARRSYRR